MRPNPTDKASRNSSLLAPPPTDLFKTYQKYQYKHNNFKPESKKQDIFVENDHYSRLIDPRTHNIFSDEIDFNTQSVS
jgi:hypothetical protein